MSNAGSCKATQLFGAWAIESSRFEEMVRTVNDLGPEKIVAEHSARLGKLAERTQGDDSQAYAVRDGVAMIAIDGPLTKHETSFSAMFGGTSTIAARRAIRSAVQDDDVNAIALLIDSPGGTVAGTHDLVDDVRAAAKEKPLGAYVEDLGASAAYAIASAASTISANRTALVGSIGVLAVLRDYSAAAEEEGVKVHVVSTGPVKGRGVAGAPVTEAHVASLQAEVDGLFEQFQADVMTGRGLNQSQFESVSTGEVFVAKKALELGLVDEIESFDDFVQRLSSGSFTVDDPEEETPRRDERQEVSTMASNAEPKAAGIAELRAEFPDAGTDFYCECLDAGMTIPQATTAYAASLQKKLEAKDAELAEANKARDAAEKKATAKPTPESNAGVDPVPTKSGGVEGAQIADVRAEVERRKRVKIDAGMAPHEAHRAVMREDPELRDRLVAVSNN